MPEPDRQAAPQPTGSPRDQPADGGRTATAIDPAALPMAISPRRLAFIAGGLALALLLVAFGHQVSDAAAASDRAAQLEATNAGLRADLTDLQGDLARAGDPTYVAVEARAYGLGAKHEIPFTLAADAPSLPPDAPGSAALRVGAEPATTSPLEDWLDLLVGSGR